MSGTGPNMDYFKTIFFRSCNLSNDISILWLYVVLLFWFTFQHFPTILIRIDLYTFENDLPMVI